MSQKVNLRTSHVVVGSLVGEWLADGRLALPRSVSLEIEVAPFVRLPDSRSTFKYGHVAVRSGSAAQNVTMEWEPGLGFAYIEPQSTTAHVTITEPGLDIPHEMLRQFLFCVCIMLLRRVGLHHVHGATLRDPRNRDWLLVGPSGSGKSTTTALLAKNGWNAGTDDNAFFAAGDAPGQVDVLAWRERVALHNDAVSATRFEGGTALGARKKTGWYAEELGSTWLDRITPTFLAFPTVNASSTTTATPLRAKEALSRTMQSSSWVMLEADRADEHLGLMTRLVKQAPAFDLSLGRDIFHRPELLLELFP